MQENGQPAKLVGWPLYGLMIGMLVTGSANTLVQKYQDDTVSANNLYTHPYLQCAIMFFGEFCCMGLYLGDKWWTERKQAKGEDVLLSPGTKQAEQQKMKTNINPLWIAIPASCDFMGSTLMFIALTMVDASVYQMMRGIIVVITALLAVCFLGRKQYRHHWLAIFCIIFGVAWVGVVAIKKDGESGDTQGSEVLGIILLLMSQCFAGIQFITEEKILGDYYLHPFRVVGTEGMFGLMYYICLLPVMQTITCGFGDGFIDSLCNFGYLENSAYAFTQMSQDQALIWQSIGIILSIACFNCFGIAITKNASAAQRSTIDTSRTVIIWGMSCALGLETFHAMTIPGFILLVFGTLLYNEIIELPCGGFNENTKKGIAKREGKTDGEKEQDDNYMGLSPQANYDQKRRIRALKNQGGATGENDDDLDDADYVLKGEDQYNDPGTYGGMGSAAKINPSSTQLLD